MSFYEAFLAEMDKTTITADAPAVAVVGACIRAAKRAQMVVDGEMVSAGPWLIDRESSGAPALDRYVGNQQPTDEPKGAESDG